ncbi:hypothetical protein [Halpernia sp. GG3]
MKKEEKCVHRFNSMVWNNELELNFTDTDEEFFASLKTVKPLTEIIKEYAPEQSKKTNYCRTYFMGFTISKKFNKAENNLFRF